MLPSHNNRPSDRPPRGERPQPQANTSTGGPQPSLSAGGVLSTVTGIISRSVSRLGQLAMPATAATVPTIKAEQIQNGWKKQLGRRYLVPAAKLLNLSPTRLEMLEKDKIIFPRIRECAEKITCQQDRNLFVLNAIRQNGAEITWAEFLNFLNKTAADVSSHAELFYRLATDPQIMITPIASERPMAEPDSEATAAATIDQAQIQENWRYQLRRQHWLPALEALKLRPIHFAMLEEKYIINRKVWEIAESCASNEDRNSVVLQHICDSGTAQTFAKFLNFVGQIQADAVSHAALFGKMSEDPNLVRQPLQQPQTIPEPMVSTPSEPHHNSPATSVDYKQLLRGALRPYLRQELCAQHMYNELWSNKVISYPLYKAIKAAPSDQQANELLIEYIEQAPDAAPWNGFLTTLKSPHLQRDFAVLEDVLEKILASAAKTATSVTVQKPAFSQKTAASMGMAKGSDPQPLAPHQQILRENWVYLADRLLAKSIANELLEKGLSPALYDTILDASSKQDANEALLESLYEADSDTLWKSFLQVLGLPDRQENYPILEEIHSALVRAELAHNSR